MKAPAKEGDALLVVIAGTGSQPLPHRPERFVEVRMGSRYAKALRLEKTTWFKEDMVQVVPRAAIVKVRGTAPPGLLLDLEEVQPKD